MTTKATEGPYRVYEVTDDDGNAIARGVEDANGIGLNGGDGISGYELFSAPDARLLAASWSMKEALKAVVRSYASHQAYDKSALPLVEAALALSEPEVKS